MFDSTKEDLIDLLKDIDACKLQLPDFQRDWVWDDDGIRSLLASIVRGFPVGAVLTLSAGGDVMFKARPLTGVEDRGIPPEEFLLDGQQRLTSLYQSIFSDKPVATQTSKGQKIQRYYYVNIEKVLDPIADSEDLIRGVPADRMVRENFGRDIVLDLSTREGEYANHLFPLNRIFNERDWIFGWRDYWRAKDTDIYDLERGFDQHILSIVKHYKMPVIRLEKNNTREAICLVFEKVNTGGKKLDAFELLTAIYAADEFNLREDWFGKSETPGRLARLQGIEAKQDVFAHLSSTDFLQACTILHTYERRSETARAGRSGHDLPAISCNRAALLGLPLTSYRAFADTVEKAFQEVGKFLNRQKIIWHRDVPYPPQSITLACAFALLGQHAKPAAAQDKFERWFWSGVLGELYGSSSESRIARDVPELVRWIEGAGPEPTTSVEALFQLDRLDSLRMRISAAYKGLHALLMRHGCRDFITGNPVDIMTFFHDSIDIHHIFPRKWCDDRKISPHLYNSIVNKTALSSTSNKSIGGRAPSEYLDRIQREHGLSTDQLDTILRSHLIEPQHLRADDFEAFYAHRKKALADLVENTMQKPIVADTTENEPMGPVEDGTELITSEIG